MSTSAYDVTFDIPTQDMGLCWKMLTRITGAEPRSLEYRTVKTQINGNPSVVRWKLELQRVPGRPRILRFKETK